MSFTAINLAMRKCFSQRAPAGGALTDRVPRDGTEGRRRSCWWSWTAKEEEGDPGSERKQASERKSQRAAEASKSLYERAEEPGCLTLGLRVPRNADYRMVEPNWEETLLAVTKVRFPRRPSSPRACSSSRGRWIKSQRFPAARIMACSTVVQSIPFFTWCRDFGIDRFPRYWC